MRRLQPKQPQPQPQPPHPRRRRRRPPPIILPPLPSSRLPPHRLRVRVPAQPLLRRHLAQSLVQLPRATNHPLCLTRVKLLLLSTTIIPLPVVSPSQAGPLAQGRTLPSTRCIRPSLVLVVFAWLFIPSWSLNVSILTYIPNTTIPLSLYFILLVTCLSYIVISRASAGSLVGSEVPRGRLSTLTKYNINLDRYSRHRNCTAKQVLKDAYLPARR